MKKLNRRSKSYNIDVVCRKRINFFIILILCCFFIVCIRLIDVMYFDKKVFTEKLDVLSYSEVEGGSAVRGKIFDRNGNLIVDNNGLKTIIYKKDKGVSTIEMIDVAKEVALHLDIDISNVSDRSKKEYFLVLNEEICNDKITDEEWEDYVSNKLSSKDIEELKIKRISAEEISFYTEEEIEVIQLFYLMNKGYTYDEKIIKSDCSEEEYAYIFENIEYLSGFNTKIDWERVYLYGDTFKEMLGTVSTSEQGIPLEFLEEYLENGYSLNDRVGLSYLEKQYENYLRGEEALFEVVNSYELVKVKDEVAGNDIYLSIDINLQREVERILEEELINTKNEINTEYYDHSTVIIQDPMTGEVLAFASKKIVGDSIIDNTTNILTSPITPGSVVKGASQLVGYNQGVISIGEVMIDECIQIMGTKEKCSSRTLGRVDDIEALAKSSNVFQFKTAIRVNGQEYFPNMRMMFNQNAFNIYREMYHSFGLGVKTEIDLPIESDGYSSNDVAAGNLLDFVMGQYETYTPLQLSQYISTIANGGERLQPQLLKSVIDNKGISLYEMSSNILNVVEVEDVYMNRIKDGFVAVMNPGGYGINYIDNKFSPAGKTGTSQSFIDTDNNGIIDTETITSSFVGYAPSNDPKMSIVVTSPNSSHLNNGYEYASDVTKRITKRVSDKFFEMYPIN